MIRRKEIHADLCVVGGGMAGLCAAIEAARCGIKVVLMHERPVLGGNASSEIRMWICGAFGENNRETGILEEIALENYYRNPTKNYYIWDTILYDFVRREVNITLLLNCTCMDADVINGEFSYGRTVRINRVSGYQMTTQTFFDVYAKNYADCSGDSILAPLTGAEFSMGRESTKEFGENTHVKTRDNLTMGISCLIQGRETEKPVKFIPPRWATKLNEENFKYRNPDLYNSCENFWYLELGGNRDCIHDAEEIKKELIPLALGTWGYIKNNPQYDAQNWELDFLSFLPGKRESRRMKGEYILTEQDITKRRQFEDTVAYGGWPLDDHFPDGFYHKGEPNTNIDTPAPYCIPYRTLYSCNVENLFFAGRNISMTHMAMSSVRVMATCALLGQAVGAAASIAARCDIAPHGVYESGLQELRETLCRHDCFLPDMLRPVCELCAKTPIINGNNSLKDGTDRPHKIYNTNTCGIVVNNGTALEYNFDRDRYVNRLHITFDSDLLRNTIAGDWCERTHMMRCNTLLDSAVFDMPKTLSKKFYVEIVCNNQSLRIFEEENNLKRAYDIEINRSVSMIRLVNLENWGGTDKTAVFSFDFI
ncbi:MAG: FAD-dependent oxidoreductase [Clostridia bacterium]|nr:FAD-dependent oxidoreductase [Clostridia bacterium]